MNPIGKPGAAPPQPLASRTLVKTPPAPPSTDDRMVALLAYALGAFTAFIGPLIVYLAKKDQSGFVAYHAMQAVMFELLISVGYMIALPLTAVLIGIPLLWALPVVSLVVAAIGGFAAVSGRLTPLPITGTLAAKITGPRALPSANPGEKY